MIAEELRMPFGKYKGETLGVIADNDLLYLDWLNGRELRGRLLTAVAEICTRRAKEIEQLLDEREEAQHSRYA